MVLLSRGHGPERWGSSHSSQRSVPPPPCSRGLGGGEVSSFVPETSLRSQMVKVHSALLVASRKARGKAMIPRERRQSGTMNSVVWESQLLLYCNRCLGTGSLFGGVVVPRRPLRNRSVSVTWRQASVGLRCWDSPARIGLLGDRKGLELWAHH